MRRGFKTWAEREAIERRKALGLKAQDALPAAILAASLNIAILAPEQIPGMPQEHLLRLLQRDSSSWSAVTLTCDDSSLIIHNTSHASTRQESDLMHELAHVLCKHQPVKFSVIGSPPLHLREYDVAREEEAEWLGACLQIPRQALLWALNRGMSDNDMIRSYGASGSLVRYRRQVTGVNRQLAHRAVGL